MKRSSIVMIGVIVTVMIIAVLYFSYPGLSGKDPHLQANKTYDQGIICENNEDFACAIVSYQKAVKLYAGDPRYYFRLAQVQTRLGDYSAAMNNYQLAKILDPSNPNVLPAFDRAMSLQATQTATYMPLPTQTIPAITPTAEILFSATPSNTPTPPVQIVKSIFDEEFGVPGVMTAAESPDDKIKYKISSEEAYTGKYSLLVSWEKQYQHWASLILAFDPDIGNFQKAQAGQMAVLNLAPPSDYAIQFFVKGVAVYESFTLKFQDQNLLIKESLGNQAVYIRIGPAGKPIPDGRFVILGTDWQEVCLPLAAFDTDTWIKDDKYRGFTPRDKQFDWSKVKQINIDSDFSNPTGAIYFDDIRIIRASGCTETAPGN
jgi:tetratricopeptide (TPR) repeat protein